MARAVRKSGAQWRWFLLLYLAGTGLLMLVSYGLKGLWGGL